MFLKNLRKLRHTLAFRLTFWYAGLFAVSSLCASLFLYFQIASFIQERTNQSLVDKLVEFVSLYSLKGMDELTSILVVESQSEGEDRTFYRILSPEGEKIFATNMTQWGEVAVSQVALIQLARGADHIIETEPRTDSSPGMRILSGRLNPQLVLQIGLSSAEEDIFLTTLRKIFGIALSLLLVFAALIGWFLARRAVLGVEEVTRTAQDIAEGAFERRVPVKARGDEIEQLATTFNSMLDRIHSLVAGMREMTDNIAHDLRSPITRIRGVAEMTLTSGKTMPEYEAMAANTVEECDRLLNMINTMLDLSEVEAGINKLQLAEVDIGRVVQDASDLFQPLAEDKNIAIQYHGPDSLLIHGDMQKMQRLVSNLLDNAIKYTQPEGTVSLTVQETNGGQMTLAVTDTGAGIAAADLPHIFERFYRCDRSRSQPGAGLGLSLALAIAHAHGGDITVTSQPGQGSTFTVVLPRLPLTHVYSPFNITKR